MSEERKSELDKLREKAAEGAQPDNAADAASELEKKVKRKKANRIFMIVIAILIAAAILFAIFFPRNKKTAGQGTATLTISCESLSKDLSQLKEKTMEKYVPKDGMILPKTEHAITPDETTVFDLLTQFCQEKDIQLEYNSTPVYGGSYIEGIGYLYEFSAGKYSGWKFKVNGKVPSYAADKVKLKDGDDVVWYYLVDYREEGF